MLASGCASGSTRSSGTSSTTALPAATAAQQVTVKMSEFALDVPAQTFAPGTYSFVASNVGHTVHSMEIDGAGVSDQQYPGWFLPGSPER